ncbi:hypothetical protein ACLOJK_002690 [Asimina triloba]
MGINALVGDCLHLICYSFARLWQNVITSTLDFDIIHVHVVQRIFKEYRQPFAITYLGVSLMTVYLPLAALKDWTYNFLRMRANSNVDKWSSLELDSPFRINGMHNSLEREMRSCLINDTDLSEREEGQPLLVKIGEDESNVLNNDHALSSWEVARQSFLLAPLWFTTEYLSNSALARTSVASTTVLSSTSGLFTLFFGACLGQDSITVAKAVAVFISMAGVAMTTVGKTWAVDDPQSNSSE